MRYQQDRDTNKPLIIVLIIIIYAPRLPCMKGVIIMMVESLCVNVVAY